MNNALLRLNLNSKFSSVIYSSFCVVLISSYMPFWGWGVNTTIYNAFKVTFVWLVVLTVTFSLCSVSKKSLAIFIVWAVVGAVLYHPFRVAYDATALSLFIVFLSAGAVFLLPPQIKTRIFGYIVAFFSIVSILSIVNFFLLLIGVDVPSIRIDQNFRSSESTYFLLYPGTIALSFVHTEMPWGGTLIRSSGIFPEPGNFGIVLGLILAALRFDFTNKYTRIITLGGFTTISGGFFAIFFSCLIIKFMHITFSHGAAKFKAIIKIWALLGVLLIIFLSLPQDFVYSFFLSKFFVTDGIIQNRTPHLVTNFYYNNIGSINMLIGYGTGYEQLVGNRSVGIYSFLIKFGYLGLFVTIVSLSILTFFSNNKTVDKIMLASAVIIILLHRSPHILNPLLVAILYFSQFQRIKSRCFSKFQV